MIVPLPLLTGKGQLSVPFGWIGQILDFTKSLIISIIFSIISVIISLHRNNVLEYKEPIKD